MHLTEPALPAVSAFGSKTPVVSGTSRDNVIRREVACNINSLSTSNFGPCSPGLNCQLSETLRGARFHFIEMLMVSAGDELASCAQEQGDKFPYTTQTQACRDIPTLNEDPSMGAKFLLAGTQTHMHLCVCEYKRDSHGFASFTCSAFL